MSTSDQNIGMSPRTRFDKEAATDREASSGLHEEKKPKSLQFKLTVFFLCSITVVGSMDAVIVGACLEAIAKDLNSSSVESFWVGTSFLLAQTVMIPIYGTTSEIFGRKWPILTAVSIFTFGSILCATAKTITWMISARVVQGIGAGGMLQLVQVILSDISTMSERGLYIAFAALAWSLGTNIGYHLFLVLWRQAETDFIIGYQSVVPLAHIRLGVGFFGSIFRYVFRL